MNNSTIQLASTLPIFKSKNCKEMNDYQDLLKLVQKFHIQKFLLKSKEELYNFLNSNCSLSNDQSCSESEESIQDDYYDQNENKIEQRQDKLRVKQEELILKQSLQQPPISLLSDTQQMQVLQKPIIQSTKQQKGLKFEDRQKGRGKETTQLIENLKQTLPFTQEFDDDSLKRLLNDFQQEDKGLKRERNLVYNRDGLMKDDLQCKFSPNKLKISQALTLMLLDEIPFPKILQAFQIQTKTYHYTIIIKDSDDTVNQLQQKIKESISDKHKVQITCDKTQIELIYDMMMLVYEKREQIKDSIMAICQGVVFQKKLRTLKEKVEQQQKNSGKICNKILDCLELINEFVHQGPMQKYIVGNNNDAQLMQQKIIKKAAKSLLFTAFEQDVPVPEVLQYLSLRKSRYNNQSNNDESLGIYIIPSIEFVKLIIDKQGMEKVQEQMKMHDIEFLDLKKLDQLFYDQSIGFSNSEEKGETILMQALNLVLQRLNELDQLQYVVKDKKFKSLQLKLNEIYKEDAFLEPDMNLELSQYVICVMNKIEIHVKKNIPEEKPQAPLCFIKIKHLQEKQFQIRNNEQELNDVELDLCKNLLLIFLWSISSKDIAFPDILQYFTLVDGKMYFEFTKKLVGIMLLSKQINNYFVTCMNMNLQIEKEIIDDVILIRRVPLLDLEINEELIPNIVDIFSKQVSILYQNRVQYTNIVIEVVQHEKIINLIKSHQPQCEGEDAIVELKCLQRFINEIQIAQKIKQDE